MITNELRERVLRQAAMQRAPIRSEARRNRALTFSAGVTVAAAIFVLAGGLRPVGRPPELMVTTVLLAAVVAAAASWTALRRGASMAGPSAEALLALLVVVPLALLAVKLAPSASWPGMTEVWPDRPGFRCLGLSLAIGAAPLFAYLRIWRHRDVPRPRLQGAALGIAAGALAWTLMDSWCPVAHPAHLVLGHLLPLAVLAAAGAVMSRP